MHLVQKAYGWSDEYTLELPFLRLWTCYNLCSFETEREHNESRFAPAWVTYFLKQILGGKDETTFESWSEGLGIIPMSKKRKNIKIDKKSEIEKSQKALDFILNADWSGESLGKDNNSSGGVEHIELQKSFFRK